MPSFVLSSKPCSLMYIIVSTSKVSKQHLFAKSLKDKSLIIDVLIQAKLLLVLFLTCHISVLLAKATFLCKFVIDS